MRVKARRGASGGGRPGRGRGGRASSFRSLLRVLRGSRAHAKTRDRGSHGDAESAEVLREPGRGRGRGRGRITLVAGAAETARRIHGPCDVVVLLRASQASRGGACLARQPPERDEPGPHRKKPHSIRTWIPTRNARLQDERSPARQLL